VRYLRKDSEIFVLRYPKEPSRESLPENLKAVVWVEDTEWGSEVYGKCPVPHCGYQNDFQTVPEAYHFVSYHLMTFHGSRKKEAQRLRRIKREREQWKRDFIAIRETMK